MFRILVVLLSLCLLPNISVARNGNERFSQLSDDQRNYLRNQHSPKDGINCCTEADGDFVEEDIRQGKYWVRSDKTNNEWIQVPDEVVINTPNKWGRAVLWIGHGADGNIFIRCYAPGSLI